MTHRHEFPVSEDIDDHICDDDVTENVVYIGNTERVTCSKETDGHSRGELEEMDRAKVYGIAEDNGTDVSWQGEDADTKDEMIDKILADKEE